MFHHKTIKRIEVPCSNHLLLTARRRIVLGVCNEPTIQRVIRKDHAIGCQKLQLEHLQKVPDVPLLVGVDEDQVELLPGEGQDPT